MTWLFDLERNWLRALRLMPSELHETLHYESARMTPWEQVDSSTGPVIPMMAYNLPPGRYIGLGNKIVKEIL
jgi:hypothetical protein